MTSASTIRAEPTVGALVLTGPAPAPALRRGTVRRDRLLRLLVQSPDVPLVLLQAPAGYGKTTLLRHWEQRDLRPFVWLSTESGPVGLALERAAAPSTPTVLVVDDADAAGDLDAVQAVMRALPPGSQLALAARTELPLATGGLRAGGGVLEIGAEDLALTRGEAAAMLSLAGVDLERADLAALVRRTEGWPAALRLATMALRRDGDAEAVAREFGGAHRLVADYVRDEIVTRLPEASVAFLRETSVLTRLSGPACDAVLERAGSGLELRELGRMGVPLVALDETDGEYRHHRLLGEMLRAEQWRTDASRTQELHRRAGAWYEAQGHVDAALEHAVAAGDLGDAGARLWSIAIQRVTHGRVGDLQAWLERLRPDQLAAEPTLALTAATVHLADGDSPRLEHWTSTAERLIAAGPGEHQATAAAMAALRATVARGGLETMVGDAFMGYWLAPEDDPWRCVSCLLCGVGLHLLGHRDRATPMLQEGARRGVVVAPAAQALCLAALALMAVEEADWALAPLLAARARAQVDRVGLGGYATSALVYAVSALVRAHGQRVDAAQEDRSHALRLLDGLEDGPPWFGVETRAALARTALRLGDVVDARRLLDEIVRLWATLQDAPRIGWLEELRAQADGMAVSSLVGPASLTTAELRVLRMLPTHLSFREMGSRLDVSANTVKTHAHAVYRKLDVCSRSEAVVRAGIMGLVDA